MVNYGNAKIYKIVRLSDDELIYVGSTTKQYLSSRLAEHKDKAKRCPNRKVYKSINENGGWENHQIVLIELCACNSKDEMHKKERENIVLLKPIANIQIPTRTIQQYYIDNKEKSKQYYMDNKEKINKYDKQYHIDNKDKINQKIICSCGRTYTHNNRARHNKSKIHLNERHFEGWAGT